MRGAKLKQRQAGAAAEADGSPRGHDLESPRRASGSAKAEAVGRGAGSTLSALPKMALLLMLVCVGTVVAFRMGREEVRALVIPRVHDIARRMHESHARARSNVRVAVYLRERRPHTSDRDHPPRWIVCSAERFTPAGAARSSHKDEYTIRFFLSFSSHHSNRLWGRGEDGLHRMSHVLSEGATRRVRVPSMRAAP